MSKKSILEDKDKYFDAFYDKCCNSRSYKEAYERLEEEIEEKHGKRRYSSYQSFRVVKYRVNKGRKRAKRGR